MPATALSSPVANSKSLQRSNESYAMYDTTYFRYKSIFALLFKIMTMYFSIAQVEYQNSIASPLFSPIL